MYNYGNGYPSPYNPMESYFRNQMNSAMQPMQQSMQQQPQQQQFITRQVTNIDEAKAAMIDALGTYVFLDYTNGKVYLKRMNNNGNADFYTFKLEDNAAAAQKADPLTEINQRLTNIENKLGGNENVSKSNERNAKPDGDDAATNNAANAAK